MDQERYVAAIEISSSKIIGVVGRYDGQGQLIIEASERESIKESVRYGIVQNLEETAIHVSRIIEKLQRRPNISPRKIKGVFVGLSGRSLRSIPTTVHRTLPEETEITSQIVEQLRQEAMSTPLDNSLEIIDVVPRVYNIGKRETTSPVGELGSEITVTYDIIVCRPEIKRNITRVLTDKCGLKVEGFVVTSLAEGHLILTNDEKRLGCMLVDMGAETTTVSIYTQGKLTYLATIPMGGRNITRDLTSLSLLEERAEEIKISSGNALASHASKEININGLSFTDISNYIVARSEEIVANILEQVDYAGLKDKDLSGGVICIGGASRLNGMIELITRQCGMNVRNGRLPNYIHLNDDSSPSGENIAVDCVLYEGATLSDAQCLAAPEAEELPATGGTSAMEDTEDEWEDRREKREPKPSKISAMLGRFGKRLGTMFAPPTDDDSDLLE